MIQRIRRIWLRQDSNLRDLIRNSGVLYAGGLVSLALTFAQQITTAGFLGAEDYGRFAVVASAAMLIMLIIDFRTWEVGTKLLTRSESEGDTAETARVTSWLLAIELITGIVGAIAIALAAPWMAQTFLRSPELAGLITLYAIAIPFRVLSLGVLSVFPRIGNRFDWLAQKSIAYAVVRLVLMTGAAGLGLGLPGVIAGAIIGEVFNFALLTLMAWQLYSPRRQRRALFDLSRPNQFDEGRRMLGQLWVSSTLYGIHQQAFIPFLSLFTSAAQIGIFRVALDIAELVERTVQPITVVVSPRIYRLYIERNRSSYVRYLRMSAAFMAALVVPVSMAIAVGIVFLIPLLDLQSFTGVEASAVLMLAGNAVNMTLTTWLRPALIAAGYYRMMNVIMLIHLALILVIVLVLAPELGALGGALAKGITVAIFPLVYLAVFLRSLRDLTWHDVSNPSY